MIARFLWKGIWRKDAKGLFLVKSYYNSLIHSEPNFIPAKRIWIASVPSKVAFFTWLVSRDKCLDFGPLEKKKVVLANRCILCKKVEETVNHLFIHCDVAWSLCLLTFNLFGIKWVLPSNSQSSFGVEFQSGEKKRKGWFGIWSHTLSFGVFGRKGTLELLRRKPSLSLSSSLISLRLFLVVHWLYQ